MIAPACLRHLVYRTKAQTTRPENADKVGRSDWPNYRTSAGQALKAPWVINIKPQTIRNRFHATERPERPSRQ